MSRRRFLGSSAVAGAAALAARPAAAGDNVGSPPLPAPICLFSKCFQPRTVTQLAEILPAIGFKNVDLTVRPGGHVPPERVGDDLPRAKETLGKAGVAIAMITTDIASPRQKHAADVIRTAATLGIRFLKLGYTHYKDMRAIHQTWADARAGIRDLVPLLAENRVHAGFHNHSGGCVGSMLWDEWELIRDLDPKWVGSYFDPAHATVEGGGGGWRIGLNLLAPRITMLAVKDFLWKKEKNDWRPRFGPLTDGTVRWTEILATLKTHGFAGPISLHVEYPRQSPPDSEDEKAVVAAAREDAAFLRAALAKAGIAAG